jgi:voltage-gated potassium channel
MASVHYVTSPLARLRLAAFGVALVVMVGTAGYMAFGLSLVDALYQTITTVTTVGFRELGEFGAPEQLFTILLIVVGVGLVLYTFTLVVQVVVEGQLREIVGRRRMDRKIADMSGHVVLCGWGRVGRAVAGDLAQAGKQVVIVDSNADRVQGVQYPTVVGDATLDATLRAAGIERAGTLVAALADDAANLFVTLSGRTLNPDLFIVARARQEDSIDKLNRAGADRVVNPQELGAARMASFVVRPHVAEFIDVVMHERSMEFRMQEVVIPAGSRLANRNLRDLDLRQQAGVLVLAVRDEGGVFRSNPDPDTAIHAGDVVIAVGTEIDLGRLVTLAAGG